MADQLATADDLRTLLDTPDLDEARCVLLIECGTAVVQAAANGQRIVEVVDDVAEVTAGPGQWLNLPQWPVQAVKSVSYNGTPVAAGAAGYQVRGSRLWRRCGWSTCPGDLNVATVVYTHGYPDGAQELQLARSAILGLIRDVVDNPAGLKAESVDDWSATYSALSTQMDGTPTLRASLRRQYRRR
ncbi:hypothetical protein [Micromonospora zhanjiangensis]|uniref:Phage gp6-like head-tail connector protein n=1 Tax=Micromonospora zhanjiangensis TaxID=1522057 RepID=A0ABV8KPI2_9ACTN